MKNTIKIGLILLALSSLLNAKEFSKIEENKVLNFNKNTLLRNPNFTLLSQKVENKELVGLNKEWTAYTINMVLMDNKNRRKFKTPYFLFTDGENITTSFINMKSGNAYGSDIIKKIKDKENARKLAIKQEREAFEKSFVLDSKLFTKERVIAGNPNAKTKVAVFSDPLCVFCIKYLPKTIEDIKNRDDIALYYFDFPLSMHPTAKTVIAAINVAKELGIKDAEYKIYKADLEKYFNVYKTRNPQISLNAVNKILGTSITLEQTKKKKYMTHINGDIQIANTAKVMGTPAFLFNGKHYNSNRLLAEFLKKNK